MSYTFRSICDILMGISFPLHFYIYSEIGTWTIVLTLVVVFAVSFACSLLVINRMRKAGYIHSDLESSTLMIQSNCRGLLGFTLALQNFNVKISAIAILYIIISSLLLEPIMNFILNKKLDEEELKVRMNIEDSQMNNHSPNNPSGTNSSNKTRYGCLKSCLLNLHIFTL